MQTLELRRKYPGGSCNEYYCELTEMLDRGSSMTRDSSSRLYRHYVLFDEFSIREKRLAIRLPGRTWGGIGIDSDMVITDVAMDEKGFGSNTEPLPRKAVGRHPAVRRKKNRTREIDRRAGAKSRPVLL